MPTTTNLKLPLIAPAQAQKHVTHNEALTALDALIFLAVSSRRRTSPPVSPADGERHLIAAAATGIWLGRDKNLAVFLDGGWRYYAPQAGWMARILDERVVLSFDGLDWVDLINAGGLSSLQNLVRLGVGTTADASNELSFKGNNLLVSAKSASEGGTGDVRTKINKLAAANTASLLLQNGYSARAEIGLIGDDDLVLKLSADGDTWVEAFRARALGGQLSIPAATADAHALNRLTADGRYLSVVAQSLSAAQRSQILANIGAGFGHPAFNMVNGTLVPSVAGNALTGSIRTQGGAVPSTFNPVLLTFRNTAFNNGTTMTRALVTAVSLTVPAGATIGHTNATIGSLYWYAIDNAGTVELAVAGSFLGNSGIVSTTAISSAAGSATTVYSGVSRANVAYQLVGRTADTQTTAGIWAAAPTHVETVTALPGVQSSVAGYYSATAALSIIIPLDDTIPQNTEGTQIISVQITPRWPTNRRRVLFSAQSSNVSAGFAASVAFFVDNNASAFYATSNFPPGAGYLTALSGNHEDAFGTTAAQTISVRVGPSGGVCYLNGTSGGRIFGGANRAQLVIDEVTA